MLVHVHTYLFLKISHLIFFVFFPLQGNNMPTIVVRLSAYPDNISRLLFTFDRRRAYVRGVSLSYLWLRLVSCKKRRQWCELASSRIHTSYRPCHQRLMARKAQRGCRRRGSRFVPSGWLYCCSSRNIKPHERGEGWLRPLHAPTIYNPSPCIAASRRPEHKRDTELLLVRSYEGGNGWETETEGRWKTRVLMLCVANDA